MSKCTIENCRTRAGARGLCQMHNRRLKLYGDPLFVQRVQRRPSETSKVTIVDNHAEIELARGEVAIIDIADVAIVSNLLWNRSTSTGYAYCSKLRVSMQQFLIGKAPPGHEIDHDNRIKLDNRKSNLKFKTFVDNHYNSDRSDNKKNVSWHKASGKWQAFISLGDEQVYVGLYLSEEEAKEARSKANTLLIELDFDFEKFKPSWKLMRKMKADTEKRDE